MTFPLHADDKGCGGKQDILLKGVYLNVLSSMIPNFATLTIKQGDRAAVDAYGFCISIVPVLLSAGTYTTYKSAWAFFVAYPCLMGSAKAWNRGISGRYSSHAFLYNGFLGELKGLMYLL